MIDHPFTLFLDLEDTIIEQWSDYDVNPVSLGRLRKIEAFIKVHGITHVNIFSNAIYDTRDLETFHTVYEPFIRTIFGVKVGKVVYVPEMMEFVTKATCEHFTDVLDFLTSTTKYPNFINYCKARFHGDTSVYRHLVLIDDVTETSTVNLYERNLKIDFIRAGEGLDIKLGG